MEEIQLKKTKKKIYQISLVSLIILLGLIIWITNYINLGFSIGDEKFRYVDQKTDEGKDYVFKDGEGNLIIIDIEELGDGYFSFADKYKLSYLDKTIYSDSYNLFEEGWQLKLADGRIYEKNFINKTMENWEEKSDIFDVQLVNEIEKLIHFKGLLSDYVIVFIFGAFAIFIGLIGIIYPLKVWKFQHMFSVADGTPTDFAIGMNMLAGLILILFGLFIYPLQF